MSQKKLCQCYFVNNSVKHWPNLIIFGMQHRKENDHSFAHLTLVLFLHYLVKRRSRILDVYNNEFMLGNACRLRKSLGWSNETRKSSKICYFFNINQEQVYRSLSRTSTNWKDASAASGPLRVMVIECAVGEWRSIYVLAFVLETDILSTYCNKDDVRWHVWLILRYNNCQSRYCLLPFS